MALHGGVLNSYGDRVWLDSRDTSSFKTYEDFEAAVKRQLDYPDRRKLPRHRHH